MTQQAVKHNPYDIIQYRRKLKQYKKYPVADTMKLLRKVREMNLPNKLLILTEIPRTLIWIANRTNESKDEQVQKMNKMCRYLAKEWKKQLGLVSQEKKEERKEGAPADKVQGKPQEGNEAKNTGANNPEVVVSQVTEVVVQKQSKGQNGASTIVTEEKVEKIVEEEVVPSDKMELEGNN